MKEMKSKIWVSSTNEGKKQKGKTPKKQHKTRNWAKTEICMVR
jgi:hypothetical protein